MNSSNFIEFVKVFRAFDWVKDNMPEKTTSLYGNKEGLFQDDQAIRFRANIGAGIETAKIFEVDDNIKRLLCMTDTPENNDAVHIPFKRVFVDVSFIKEELAELGINIRADKLVGILATEGILTDGKIIAGTDLNLCMLSREADGDIWFDDFNKNFSINDEYKDMNLKVSKCRGTDPIATDFIHKFFLNFLNFLNNPEVEYIEHKRSEKNQERRMKNGKAIIPSTYSINVTGRLKQYIDDAVNSKEWTYNYRFWVRGHFRQLESDRYIEKKRIWILPYIKGKGVLVEKSYQLSPKKAV